MNPEAQEGGAEETARPRGRPKLDAPRRVRITTTIEPAKLALLRAYAQRRRKSLGQLADEYVQQHFPPDEMTQE